MKPKFGWAAAVSKKNVAGSLSTLQKSAGFGSVIAGSCLQVPACHPESTLGSWGLLGAMTENFARGRMDGVMGAVYGLKRIGR